jgi:hypothetical protein
LSDICGKRGSILQVAQHDHLCASAHNAHDPNRITPMTPIGWLLTASRQFLNPDCHLIMTPWEWSVLNILHPTQGPCCSSGSCSQLRWDRHNPRRILLLAPFSTRSCKMIAASLSRTCGILTRERGTGSRFVTYPTLVMIIAGAGVHVQQRRRARLSMERQRRTSPIL